MCGKMLYILYFIREVYKLYKFKDRGNLGSGVSEPPYVEGAI